MNISTIKDILVIGGTILTVVGGVASGAGKVIDEIKKSNNNKKNSNEKK